MNCPTRWIVVECRDSSLESPVAATIKVTCANCGTEYDKNAYEVKRNERLGRANCCNRSCHAAYMNKSELKRRDRSERSGREQYGNGYACINATDKRPTHPVLVADESRVYSVELFRYEGKIRRSLHKWKQYATKRKEIIERVETLYPGVQVRVSLLRVVIYDDRKPRNVLKCVPGDLPV